MVRPGSATTTSFTSSSPSSEGTPTAAHSATPSRVQTARSTSVEEIISPRRRMASAARSTQRT